MAIKTYNCTALTGGAVRALDAISQAVLTNGDRAMTVEGGKLYVHVYNSASTAAESSPGNIRPDDYSGPGVWENQSSPFGDVGPTITATVPIEGDIRGGNVSISGATMTIGPCSCKDSTGLIPLYTGVDKTVDFTGAAANTLYYVFKVRLVADSSVEYRKYTSYAGVAADAQVDAYRLRTIWRTNGSNAPCAGSMVGDLIRWGKASEQAFGSGLTSSYATVSHSALMDEAYIKEIEYGVRDAGGTQSLIVSSIDGTNVEAFIGDSNYGTSDTDANAWGNAPNGGSKFLPFSVTRKFKTISNNGKLCISAMRLKV